MIIGDAVIKLQSMEQFIELKKKQTVFLFSAQWCPDCRYIESFFDEIENKFSYMDFVYIDRDEFIDLCIEYDVYGIPSFLVFKNDQLQSSFVSKLKKTKEEIIRFLETTI